MHLLCSFSIQDSMKFPSLETRLLDIIRSPSDPPDNLSGWYGLLLQNKTIFSGGIALRKPDNQY